MVEKRHEVFIYPKARNLSFRSLEILRGLGVGDKVHAAAEGTSDMVVKPTLNSVDVERVMDFDKIFAEFDELSPEPSMQYCPQSKLEPILLAYLRGLGSAAHYGDRTDLDRAGRGRRLRGGARPEFRRIRGRYAPITWSPPTVCTATSATRSAWPRPATARCRFTSSSSTSARSVAGIGSRLGEGGAVQVTNAAVDAVFVAAEGDLGMFITTYFPSRGESAAGIHTRALPRADILAAAGEQMGV